jgi:hypothetical protein
MTNSAPDEYLIRVLVGAVEYQLVRTIAGRQFSWIWHMKDPSNVDFEASPICRSDVRSTSFAKRSITLRALMPLSIQLVPNLSCAAASPAW